MKFLRSTLALAWTALFATAAAAQTESIVYSFPSGAGLYSRLYEDTAGAIYGAEYNGPKGDGAIYQLVEKKGVWKKNQLVAFTRTNGKNPFGGLEQDPSGVLYGTTFGGGTGGSGTVFSLTEGHGRHWSQDVIHDFVRSDGSELESNIVIGKTGALFGTATEGGSANCGTIYELAEAQGTWTETTLYTFKGGQDGCYPEAGLHTATQEGTLYGSTVIGGTYNQGTVFQFQESNGVWTKTILHQFTGGDDGGYPKDMDVDGGANIYGIAFVGGTSKDGLLFVLSSQEQWQETVIHNFAGGSDGNDHIGVHFDRKNNTLYGTTTLGGSGNAGTVFQFTGSGDNWEETILHSFGTSANDGVNPWARPIVDQATGALYGTTLNGGTQGGGTVWIVTP
jgi:uncharacterized repeat protein (TIGR03803 family)